MAVEDWKCKHTEFCESCMGLVAALREELAQMQIEVDGAHIAIRFLTHQNEEEPTP